MAKFAAQIFVVLIFSILSMSNAQRVQSNVSHNSLGRVVGGQEADPHKYPFQVAIFYKNIGLLCGGSLYNRDTVITAAHCFSPGKSTSNYIVALGKHDLSKREDPEVLTTIKSITNHPGFSKKVEMLNDIAIVKLSTKVCLNEFIDTIPIAKPGSQLPSQGFISGWGYTEPRQSSTALEEEFFLPVLKSAEAKVLDDESCKKRFRELNAGKQALDLADSVKTFCAWHEEGHDTCQGDSGGPMFHMLSGNPRDYELCGIVSTGIGCGQKDTPALYTRVSEFHKWITDTAGPPDLGCEP